ncbi:hypothetical protein WJX72_004451 [[Myrmecia] bisecta]|uniref:PH domain-containing protein n=1 Tax=[Myrmecia] bisecta TaxID=41462 RepID=A0AAW1PNT4_9CHLO
MRNQVCLWSSPDLAGWLEKQGDGLRTWLKRYFILKGSNLFYFKNEKKASAGGVIPLEGAQILLASDPDPHTSHRHLLRVKTSTIYRGVAKRTIYILCAKNVKVQAAWGTILQHASIPRTDMLAQLHQAGRLPQMLQAHGVGSAALRAEEIAELYALVQGGTLSPAQISVLWAKLTAVQPAGAHFTAESLVAAAYTP